MKHREPETRIVAVDGREVRMAHWKTAPGGKDAKPLLFFNGIGANMELIAPFAERLSRDVITFDMPGVGGSPDPVWPYRPWQMARVADGIVEDLGHAAVDVLGISWGGGMAQQFALQYPRRTGRLVLVATTAGMLMVPGKLSALSKMVDPRRYADPDFMRRHFDTLYGGQSNGSADHTSRIKAPSRLGYFYQLLAMAGWTSAPFLPLISAETLILMGDSDAIVRPINGRLLEKLIPGARMVTIADGGHLFLMSHADEVVPMIEDFLDRGHRPLARAA